MSIMKYTIIISIIIMIIGVSIACNKYKAIALKENKSTKNVEVILPSNILNSVNTIKSKLDDEANANGIPIELKQTSVSINDRDNYVVTFNLKKDNKIMENKTILFEYNESGKIQSLNIRFTNSVEDIPKMMKLVQKMLQIRELHIPEDEANQVVDILNNSNLKNTWTETINGRTYSWMNERNSENNEDVQTFTAEYNY